MKIRKFLLMALPVALSYTTGFAQQVIVASASSPVKKDVEVNEEADVPEEKPKVTMSGYIDSYYLHAFNNPKSGTLMGDPAANAGYPVGRAFDRVSDQFALGLVQTKFSYSDKKSDLVIDDSRFVVRTATPPKAKPATRTGTGSFSSPPRRWRCCFAAASGTGARSRSTCNRQKPSTT